jgi:alginate O-acetyltransferase complex protein AlgJ
VHEAWLPREHSLHRPRHGRRQLTALSCALVFFAAPTLMWVGGMRPSEIENHQLADFPSMGDGWLFFTDMDGWATDNLVFRAGAVQATDWVSRTFFGEPAPFDQGGGAPSGPLGGAPSGDDTEPAPGDTDDDADQAGYRRVIEGADGWLYFGKDTLNKCEPGQPLDTTVAALVELRRIVEDSGRKFVFVPVPDKSTMVPDYLPDSYPGKDCAAAVTPDLWRKLLRVAGGVDIRPRLQGAADRVGHPVYYKLDTHWTHEGALEMVGAAAETVSPSITDRWKVQPQEQYSNPADLPPLIGQKGDNVATLYRLKPDGKTSKTTEGSNKLNNPVHHTSDPVRGMVTKPTVVLGDSFLLTASYYLPGAFSDVTMQYYHSMPQNPAQTIKTMVDSEVVVLQAVERNIADGAVEVLTQEFLTPRSSSPAPVRNWPSTRSTNLRRMTNPTGTDAPTEAVAAE